MRGSRCPLSCKDLAGSFSVITPSPRGLAHHSLPHLYRSMWRKVLPDLFLTAWRVQFEVFTRRYTQHGRCSTKVHDSRATQWISGGFPSLSLEARRYQSLHCRGVPEAKTCEICIYGLPPAINGHDCAPPARNRLYGSLIESHPCSFVTSLLHTFSSLAPKDAQAWEPRLSSPPRTEYTFR